MNIFIKGVQKWQRVKIQEKKRRNQKARNLKNLNQKKRISLNLFRKKSYIYDLSYRTITRII